MHQYRHRSGATGKTNPAGRRGHASSEYSQGVRLNGQMGLSNILTGSSKVNDAIQASVQPNLLLSLQVQYLLIPRNY